MPTALELRIAKLEQMVEEERTCFVVFQRTEGGPTEPTRTHHKPAERVASVGVCSYLKPGERYRMPTIEEWVKHYSLPAQKKQLATDSKEKH